MRLLCCLLIANCMALPATATVKYTVSIKDQLNTVNVNICFDGSPDDPHPRDLYINNEARSAIHNLRWNNRTLPSLANWRPLRINRSDNTGCLAYQASLTDSGERWGYTSSDYMLTDPKHWLLGPPQGSHAIIHFDLPDVINVSHPWPGVVTNDDSQWFQLGLTSASWSSNVAFGRFEVENIAIADTFLRMTILPGRPAPNPRVTREWVLESALSVLNAHGDLPQNEPQVIIMPVGRQNQAIPFARVLRGGGIGLQFFVDPRRPLRDYSADWKPAHEFSHLLLPYISRKDAWLSEGLASYYQNVMRARDGRLNEREAWDQLLAGFERGRKGVTNNRTLAEEASGMHQNRSYKRVYWSGAAMLFLADVELRKRTNGRHNLDTALAGVAECCMEVGKIWRARDMMQLMDEVTNNNVFMQTYHQYTRSRVFPDVKPTLTDLGVSQRWGRVRLNNQAKFAFLRKQIMRQVSSD